MKGVLICGGTGSRLKPLTEITNKSLLPVYDKPLICYPLQVMLDAGIKDVAVITGPEHMDQMTQFLGSGSRFGCEFAYRVQETPGGIAQALGLAEEFADGDSVCAMLGDNVFFDDISETIKQFSGGAHLFVKKVPDPQRFGVVELDTAKNPLSADNSASVVSIVEKPRHPKTDLIATGCYLYDNRCFEVIRSLKPSGRNELEITDVSNWYIGKNECRGTVLQDEWIDAGTFESLFRAAELVRERKGL